VTDTVKDTSRDAIRALHDLRLRTVMVTGDRAEPAEAVAREVGIDRVVAGVLPDQKVDVVRQLQSEGRRVAVVGDGINDAPALAQADLGIAIGPGTDVAIEASDSRWCRVICGRPPMPYPSPAGRLATIKGNLFWAFAYNVAATPLAAVARAAR
jgi:Cu+-exporting ATPase